MSLHVIDPGLYSQVVDGGRPGNRSLGVPPGGAADKFALAIGNALVGNPADAAALEVTWAGPRLRAEADVACVLYGAAFSLRLRDEPLRAGRTFTLQAGETLEIGAARRGVRAYLCVHGGIEAPVILGSRSALERLRAGETLRCQASATRHHSLDPCFRWNRLPRVLRFLDGPQAEWFAGQAFASREYRVRPQSDRMG